jgi:hypothetical protein
VETTEEAELRGLADVAMVQAADFGKLHDLPCRGEFDRPEVGRVLVEGEVGPHLMVVGKNSGPGCGGGVARRGRARDSGTRAGSSR